MTRAALYIRVSTEEQKLHGLSVEAQTEALDAWAKSAGVAVAGHYIDPGISARKKADKRPALQRLLQDVREGKIDLIVFTKLDRWFRNVGEYYKVQEVLDNHKVAWKTIHEDYETSTAAGRLKVNIMLSVAQDEADRTSERIKRVFELKRGKGEPLGGMVPTGYKLEEKKIVKDPATEPAVATFFQKYLESGSISAAIDDTEVRTGVRFKYQLASRMLSNPAYYGVFNGTQAMCPAYITKDQFDQIAAGRRRTVRKSPMNRTYLFSGMLTCGECGARMGGRTHKISGVEKAEYNCPGHYQKKGCGNRTNIREAAIETYLLATVDRRLKQYLADTEVARNAEAVDHSAEIAKYWRQLAKAKELFLNELITLDEYRQDHDRIMPKIQALEAAQSTPKEKNADELKGVLYPGWKELYESLDRPGKRAFWRLVIKEIWVFPDRHIKYDFL